MAKVVQGGLVGPTGAQQTQQSIQGFNQALQQRNALAETARQFNVGTEFDLLTKLSQGNSLGILGVAQSDQGAGLFGSMFDKMGISDSTRKSFFETTASLPPTAQASYETMVSLMLRNTAAIGGERATEENLANIAQEFQGAEKLPIGQRDQAQVAGVPTPSPEGGPVTEFDNTVIIPGTAGTAEIDLTEQINSNFVRFLSGPPGTPPDLRDKNGILYSIGRNNELSGQELDDFVNRAIPVVEKRMDALMNKFSSEDPEALPAINILLEGEAGTEDRAGVSVFGNILSRFDETDTSEMQTLGKQWRDAGSAEEKREIANQMGILADKVIPKIAQTEGFDDFNLSADQALALRQQIISNGQDNFDLDFIPSEEEKANLPWWQGVSPIRDRGEAGVKGDIVPRGKLPKEEVILPGRTISTEAFTASGRGDFVPRPKAGVSIGAVNKVNANYEEASVNFQNNPTDPEAIKDLNTANGGLIRVTDFLEAEKNPEVRARILRRFDQVMNDPQALEGLAGAIPDNAQTFLTLAAQRRYEKLEEEGNLPIDPKLALELEKLSAEAGFTKAKALELLVDLSTKTGLDFANIGPETLGKVIMFQTRGEGVFSDNQLANLSAANEAMAKIIADRGNSAVEDQDFKDAQKFFNDTMNAGLNTPGVNYTVSNGGWIFGDLWRAIIGKPELGVETLGSGQAVQEIELSDTAQSLEGDFF